MDELTLATIDSPDCRVSEHIAILIASGDAPEIDIESRVVDGFSEALELLEEGELDMWHCLPRCSTGSRPKCWQPDARWSERGPRDART